NDQIPVKLYEYLRAGRPILALTDPKGDTAWCLNQFGISALSRLDDSERIASLIEELPKIIDRQFNYRSMLSQVECTSRKGRTSQFVDILDLIANVSLTDQPSH
ncbi:MAG: hypothetical protein JZU59_12415, partial [Chromatium okenii]|nr:hypothetical protein [Chromatium okenii]